MFQIGHHSFLLRSGCCRRLEGEVQFHVSLLRFNQTGDAGIIAIGHNFKEVALIFHPHDYRLFDNDPAVIIASLRAGVAVRKRPTLPITAFPSHWEILSSAHLEFPGCTNEMLLAQCGSRALHQLIIRIV